MAAERDTYALHGLTVESELPLDAPLIDADPDYRLVLAPERAAEGAPDGRLLGELHHGGMSFWCAESPDDPQRWLLRYRDVGDIEFDRRTGVLAVFPVPGQTPDLLGALIGGSVLALLLSAQGEMVMHASAVEVGGRVLAVIGASGSGKTTTAALLCAAGAPLVSDDALRIDPADSHRCYLGTNTLRLRPGAAELAASIPNSAEAETADGRAGVVPARPGEDRELRLGALLVPQPDHDSKTLEVERLGERQALVQLASNPRVISWRDPEPLRAYFDAAARLAAEIPIFSASVPWGPPFEPGLADTILEGVGLASEPAAG